MVKDLKLLKIIVPNEFVVGDIIIKLPPSWRDFTTTLKHKMTRMFTSDLIVFLDVEEKAQTKDGRCKGIEGQTNTNMVHQLQSHGKDKGKQIKNNSKPKQNTTFKKKNKEEDGCFVCDSPDHWAKKCLNCKGGKPQPKQKTANMVTIAANRTSGYGNLPSIILVFQSTTWWLDSGANVHVCSDASLFSSY
jgi:hypothetical protein